VCANAARTAELKLGTKKSGFLIQGELRRGAVTEILCRVGEANLNVTSAQVFCAGLGRGIFVVSVGD
jgi:hypothetical protein